MSGAQEGYRPSEPSARGFSIVLILIALVTAATWLLDDLIGQPAAAHAVRIVGCVVFIMQGARLVLHPERVGDAEPRTLRLCGVALIIFFTALGTLSIQKLFFPE